MRRWSGESGRRVPRPPVSVWGLARSLTSAAGCERSSPTWSVSSPGHPATGKTNKNKQPHPFCETIVPLHKLKSSNQYNIVINVDAVVGISSSFFTGSFPWQQTFITWVTSKHTHGWFGLFNWPHKFQIGTPMCCTQAWI